MSMMLMVLLGASTSVVNAFTPPKSSSFLAAASRPIQMASSATATSTTTTKAYDWSFIDRVYLITCPNADPDGTRLSTAQSILETVNLKANVTVKPFDTDDEDRIRGCYTSHISVLQDALVDLERSSSSNNNPWDAFVQKVLPPSNNNNNNNKRQKQGQRQRQRRILVLEDNIAATGNLDQAGLDAIQSYADDTSNHWDVIHLAYIPYVPSLTVVREKDRLVKLNCGIGSALGTTAYIITEDAIRILCQQHAAQSYYAAIPDVMAELFPTTRYAAFPTPFLRAPQTKSLVNPQLDELRQVLFRPTITSFVQRILTMTGWSTNQLLPLTIGTLLAVSGISGKMSVEAMTSIVTTGSYQGDAPLPVVAVSFVICIASLALIAQGVLLAPQPPATATNDEEEEEQASSSVIYK
eukprot:CAMPEP_0119002896 /NCGR_PEP_ID=MMETSP1176-20130426/217_1 /TAXON_ID=265551 /ORGANISM="Synedropsis recta cf, Strain CCMP1620" /LENGTH=409 /DNA_ID=CAMNT_0006954433 /DNA_START=95 /DNA_END=1324 /DNA_ORIENTATION=+